MGRPGGKHIGLADIPLFYDCPVSACVGLVGDPRTVCGGCLAAFGPYLRPVAHEPAPAEPVKQARKPKKRATQEVEWRRNQRCWVCEQRRSCREDPDSSNGWICRKCLAIQ